MKKKYLYGLLAVVMAFSITGCGKKDEKSSDGSFTITCTTKKDNSTGFEIQSVINYTFNKDQLTTGYTSDTTQVFNDEETYNTYKEAQQETVNNNTEESITYNLKTDDENKTLVFSMTLKVNPSDAETEEEKNSLKANTILKNNETNEVTCELKGITREELK